MKLPIICSQCMNDDLESANILTAAEIRDDGRYEVRCPKGHTSVILLQQQKFEILFDLGAYAVADGYYREAVSSFTSGLELFHEFFIKVACISKGIEWDTILKTWKNISNHSERQLGAFIFLYLQELGSEPSLLGDKKVKFRNYVIHRGKIPTREEAVNYGQAVLDIIRPIILILKEKYNEAVHKATYRHISETRTSSDDGKAVSTMCKSTIISLSTDDPAHHEMDLETAIAQLKHWKKV